MTAQLTVICLTKYSQINDIVPRWPYSLKKKRNFTESCICDSSVLQPMHGAVICGKSRSNGIRYGTGEFWKEGETFAMLLFISNAVIILFWSFMS